MGTEGGWQAFVSTGGVQEYLDYKQAQRSADGKEQQDGTGDGRTGTEGSEGRGSG